MEEEAQVLVRIPADLHRRFKVHLAYEGKTMKEELLDFIQERVD